MPKRIEVRISGLGGQGVVLVGEILGRAAVYDGKNAVQTQDYGAEARGTAAKSEVIISDGKIGFPKVIKCDILVAMSQSAVEIHLKDLKKNGILIVDEDMVKHLPKTKAKVFKIPATKTAETYANVVMLGSLAKITGIVKEKAIEKAITNSVPETAREANIKAFKEGLKLIM